jgi:energy-coupling factor transporter transmembrane protein EcfT
MIARIFVTAIVFLLAVGAFWGDALGAGHVFNPFGILLLGLGLFIWFGWSTVHDAFISAKDESNVPIIRLGSAIIRGMENLKHPTQPRRSSSP